MGQRLDSRPPRLAEWLLRAMLRHQDRDAVLGDLAEEFDAHGRAWYWKQVFASAAPALARRFWLRAVVAVAFGYVTAAAHVVLLDLLWWGRVDATYLVISLVTGFLFLVFGGWMAARLALRCQMGHAAALGILTGLLAVVYAGWMASAMEPWSYRLGLVAVSGPGPLMGGWLVARSKKGRQA